MTDEARVLEALALHTTTTTKGLTYRDIAEKAGVPPRHVNTYLTSLYRDGIIEYGGTVLSNNHINGRQVRLWRMAEEWSLPMEEAA